MLVPDTLCSMLSPRIVSHGILAMISWWMAACSMDTPTATNQRSSASPEKESSASQSTSDEGETIAASTATDQSDNSEGTAASSLSLFQTTVYPLARQYCASCHATVSAPFFAAEDVQKAHDALVVGSKVNLNDPASSRIVMRMIPDQHNCWSTCTTDAQTMLRAVEEWAKGLQQTTPEPPLLVSQARRLADARDTVVSHQNKPGTIVLEAEAGTLKAPMVIIEDTARFGGVVVGTPPGAGNSTNLNQAINNNNLGTLSFTINIATAGDYRLYGLVQASTDAQASFYARFNSEPLRAWLFKATGAEYAWDIADPVAEIGTAHTFSLQAGQHVLEIRQRQEQAKLDRIALSLESPFDPAAARVDGVWTRKVLEFDIGALVGVSGAKLTVEVQDYNEQSYLLSSPTIITPVSLQVKNLKLLINDSYLEQHATYTVVDKLVQPPGEVLLDASLLALKDKGVNEDRFSFSFGTLQKVP